ncbi:serine hydrolase domain-containing protein [Rhodohalobacter halophilus]|uniref:serine hydrolase domain-containing protein n=1 Tax=Rhodohalobacter halophilus TaxID=1812810 RepID=UPI00083F5BDB|nr:serine hydrolase domain-containing protein [Rhodohalobacter halophilus]
MASIKILLINLIGLFLLFAPSDLFSQTFADSSSIAQLDSIFSDWNSETTPGCAVGISQEGRPLVMRAYGMADLENPVPNTPSTIFEAGSVSKQFVAASLILLSLEGEISLEDDVRNIIPELPDYGDTITWRHLLNHTSGLRDWGSVASISGWGRSNRTHNHDHVLDIVSRQTRLNFPPGERYSYSNTGYNLMAIAIERITGTSFADYSNRKIFDPLGMTSTQWRDDYTRIVKGRSSAYSGRAGDEEYTINRPIEHVHGNGGLLTTIGDLLTWTSAIQSNYFGEDFHEELVTQGVLESGRTIAYASGVRVDEDHGYRQITHTGATSGYRAYLSIYPESDLAVALLCNVTGASPGSLGSAVSDVFLEEPDGDESQPEKGTVRRSDEQLKEWTGIWSDPRNYRATEITWEAGELKLNGNTTLYPISGSEVRVGNSDTLYRFVDQGSGDLHIQVIREGFEEEILNPEKPAPEFDESWSNFEGVYVSSDAETEIRIELRGDQLIAHRRPADTFELEPLYENTFSARGLGLIRFVPGSNGVMEFIYSSGRVYDLRFEKQD